MRIPTLIAGYIAGLAIATKYKKSTSKSKKAVDPTKSKLDLFIDEMVDLHKSAFEDIKNSVSVSFEKIEDFPTLKTKLLGMAEEFSHEFESRLSDISGTADEKKTQAMDWLETVYEKYKTTLTNAKNRAEELSGTAGENVTEVVTQAEEKIKKEYNNAKKKLESARQKSGK